MKEFTRGGLREVFLAAFRGNSAVFLWAYCRLEGWCVTGTGPGVPRDAMKPRCERKHVLARRWHLTECVGVLRAAMGTQPHDSLLLGNLLLGFPTGPGHCRSGLERGEGTRRHVGWDHVTARATVRTLLVSWCERN